MNQHYALYQLTDSWMILGGNIMSKPKCKLIGTDGNIFTLAGRVQKTLKKEGLKEQAEEFMALLPNCRSYDEAIRLIMEYVEVE